MAEYESYPDDYKPYPLREFLISDRFGNHIFYFKFYAAKIDVMSEDDMDNPVPCAYPNYETSLNADLEQYPDISELILQLLQFDLETSFFNKIAQELFKKIKLISEIENYYFPNQVLTNGYINWEKYRIYKCFANQ